MRITSIVTALLAALLISGGTSEKARAGLFVSITVAPPALPVYAQPPIPGPGYIWTPGYWAWGEDAGDYYWVPGAWAPAPEPGLLWTPGYWGWSNGVYVWNAGYWGPHIGFYGGINYGFGYAGAGFDASKTVINNTTINNTTNVSFNGGNGGTRAQPTAQDLAAANERHVGPSADQIRHQELASKNPALKLANNHGKPAIAATAKAGDFSKGNTVAAKSAGGAKPQGHNAIGKGTGNASAGGSFKAHALKSEGKPDGHQPAHGKGTGNASASAFNRGATGNTLTTVHHGAAIDRGRSDPRLAGGGGRTVQGDAKKITYPANGAPLNRVRHPGPPAAQRPGQRPAIKQPPKHNDNHG